MLTSLSGKTSCSVERIVVSRDAYNTRASLPDSSAKFTTGAALGKSKSTSTSLTSYRTHDVVAIKASSVLVEDILDN